MKSLLDQFRALKRPNPKCVTCNNPKVLASIAAALDLIEAGKVSPSLEQLYQVMKQNHPQWKATSTSTLRNHLVRHEPRWKSK